MNRHGVLCAVFLTLIMVLSAAVGFVWVSPALATKGSYPGTNGQIVFEREPSEGALGGLWIMNADGSNLRQLLSDTGGTGGHEYDEPAWSPDGTRILFADAGSAPGLYIIDPSVIKVDGSNLPPPITGTPTGVTDEADPAWSPDGTKIVYTFCQVTCKINDLVVINVDGSGATTLVTSTIADEPSWSSDGREIAYSSGGNLYVIDVITKAVTQLVSGSGADDPNWSPDCPTGRQIAYESSAGISVIEVSTKQVRVLDTAVAEDEPNWSPDGKFIIFHREGTTVPGIYIKNADGTGTATAINLHAGDDDPDYQRLGGPVCALPVGGGIMPANMFATFAQWLAVIGLVGYVGTVIVVARMRRA